MIARNGTTTKTEADSGPMDGIDHDCHHLRTGSRRHHAMGNGIEISGFLLNSQHFSSQSGTIDA